MENWILELYEQLQGIGLADLEPSVLFSIGAALLALYFVLRSSRKTREAIENLRAENQKLKAELSSIESSLNEALKIRRQALSDKDSAAPLEAPFESAEVKERDSKTAEQETADEVRQSGAGDIQPKAEPEESAVEAKQSEETLTPEIETVKKEAVPATVFGGLTKTRSRFFSGLSKLFGSSSSIDQSALLELEELLITSDLGVQTSKKLLDSLRQQINGSGITEDSLRQNLQSSIEEILQDDAQA